jgi:hypothetical protein
VSVEESTQLSELQRIVTKRGTAILLSLVGEVRLGHRGGLLSYTG